MVKYEVFDRKKEEKEKIVRLGFEFYDDGECKVVAVDEDGVRMDSGTLLVFTTKGRIRLCEEVSESLGFDLDEAGRIKIVK